MYVVLIVIREAFTIIKGRPNNKTKMKFLAYNLLNEANLFNVQGPILKL